MLRWRQVEPHHISRFRSKLRVIALAPGLAAGKVDLMGAQKAPDILLMHIAQVGRYQRRRPARKAGRRWLIQHRQDPPASRLTVFPLPPSSRALVQPSQPLARVATTPQAHRPRHHRQLSRDRAGRTAARGQQHNPRPHHIALRRRRRPHPSLQLSAILPAQPDFNCIGYHPDVESRITQLR